MTLQKPNAASHVAYDVTPAVRNRRSSRRRRASLTSSVRSSSRDSPPAGALLSALNTWLRFSSVRLKMAPSTVLSAKPGSSSPVGASGACVVTSLNQSANQEIGSGTQ